MQINLLQLVGRARLTLALLLNCLLAVASGVRADTPIFYYYHSDHLGSTSLVTNAQGLQVDHYQYTSYGRTRSSAPTGLPLTNRFTSQDYDDGSGMYYYNARYYDSELGNFIQPDTIVPEPGDPQSLNRYSYVENNPLNKTDPSGHQSMVLSQSFSDPQQVEANYQMTKALVLSPYHFGNYIGNEAVGIYELSRSSGDTHVQALTLAVEVGVLRFSGGMNMGEAIQGQQIAVDGSSQISITDFGSTAERLFHGGIGVLIAGSEAFGGVSKLGLGAKSGATVADELAAAATRAQNTVGPGKGGAYGTRVHSAFEAEVQALGRDNVRTEVSYLNGVEVPRGTTGSVRLDVVEFGQNGQILKVYDPKTGSAALTPARITEIQSHIPGGANVPVLEVRP